MFDSEEKRCPVCAMRVVYDDPTLEYQKMSFHFCSEQCRETFMAHPQLYSGRRAREIGEVVKRRRIRLSAPVEREVEQRIVNSLEGLMGAKEIQMDGRSLLVRYDLLQLTLEQLESALLDAGVELDNGWWQRLWRAWIRDAESNELNNLAARPAACCNRAPPRS